MSWTSRLKKTVGGASAEKAVEAADAKTELELPPVVECDAKTLSRDEVVEILAEDLVLLSENQLSRDEIDPNGHIFDYGYVDSLSAVIFLARIEERFGTQLEDMELIETTTDLFAIADRIQSS